MTANIYIPTTDEVKDAASINGATAIESAAFDRWLSTRDSALREQIAAEVLGPVRALRDRAARESIDYSDGDPTGETLENLVRELDVALSAPVQAADAASEPAPDLGVRDDAATPVQAAEEVGGDDGN